MSGFRGFRFLDRPLSSQTREIEKRAYYQNNCIESNHFLHSDKDHQMPFVGGPHTRTTNPRWQTAAILEKSKNCYISAAVRVIMKKFGKMMQFEPLERPDRKNLKLQKSNMAAAAILEKSKYCYISAAVRAILTLSLIHISEPTRPY